MSDKTKSDESEPIKDQDLDKVSGGYIVQRPIVTPPEQKVPIARPKQPEPC